MSTVKGSRARRTNRRPLLARWIAFAILCGCAGATQAPEAGSAAVSSAGSTELKPEAALLPFSSGAKKLAEIAAVTERIGAPLIEKCMVSSGFDYASPPDLPEPDYLNVNRRYGISDLEQVSKYGYDLPPRSDAVEALDLSDEEGKALYGDPATASEVPVTDPEGNLVGGFVLADGCLDEGLTTAFGGVELRKRYLVATKLFEASAATSFSTLLTSPEWLTLTASWAACMAQSGYAGLTTPLDVPGEISEGVPDTAKAVTDVGCKQDLGFLDKAIRIEAVIQVAMIEGAAAPVFEAIENLPVPG